jgi:hypothetical protein
MTTKKTPPRLKVEKVTITLNLPIETNKRLDTASELTGISRSAYADRALLEQMNRDGIPED